MATPTGRFCGRRQPCTSDRGADGERCRRVLAFWTSGLFFLERAYVLLVFAGIWALAKGITDIVRAFEIRKLATR